MTIRDAEERILVLNERAAACEREADEFASRGQWQAAHEARTAGMGWYRRAAVLAERIVCRRRELRRRVEA